MLSLVTSYIGKSHGFFTTDTVLFQASKLVLFNASGLVHSRYFLMRQPPSTQLVLNFPMREARYTTDAFPAFGLVTHFVLLLASGLKHFFFSMRPTLFFFLR